MPAKKKASSQDTGKYDVAVGADAVRAHNATAIGIINGSNSPSASTRMTRSMERWVDQSSKATRHYNAATVKIPKKK